MATRRLVPVPDSISDITKAHYLILPALGLLWGSSYLWISLLNEVFNPPVLVAIRVLTATLVLLAVLGIRRTALPAFGLNWLHIFIVAVVADLVPFFLLVWSQHHVASSVAAVIGATVPLFTLLIATLVFRNERMTGSRVIGIVIGFAGVILLSGFGVGGTGGFINPGVVAVLLSSLFYGFGFVYARRYVRGDPFGIVAAQMLMSLTLTLPLAIVTGSVQGAVFNPRVVLAAIALGGLSSGIGYCVYYAGLEQLGPTMTSYGTYLAPIVAIALGWIFLDERIGPIGFAGILLIVAGIATAVGWSSKLLKLIDRASDAVPDLPLSVEADLRNVLETREFEALEEVPANT